MAEPKLIDNQLRPTPFDRNTSEQNPKHQWIDWAGYRAVTVYDTFESDYFKLRAQCGLIDISPMRKYLIKGKDAERMLNRMVTRDVRKIRVNRVSYVAWCDTDGHVIDDGTLFRLNEDTFWLCCQEPQYHWLMEQADGFACQIDELEYHATLSLQGPTSFAVLRQLDLPGLEHLKPFSILQIPEKSLTISRTGFTGDLGYELWTNAENADSLWQQLMQAGKDYGIAPVGLSALDMARVEAGFIQPGADFISSHLAQRPTRGKTPFSLGLGALVDFNKCHFNGRRALYAQRHQTPKMMLVALDIDGNKPANDAFIYLNKRKEVGTVTSAYWSPTCKRNIAYAWIRGDLIESEKLWVEIYFAKELKWDRVMVRAKIVKRPFFNHPRRRQTPPGLF